MLQPLSSKRIRFVEPETAPAPGNSTPRCNWRWLCAWGICAWGLSLTAATTMAAEPDELEFFEKKIRPVLIEHCYKCHAESGESIKGGLELDHRDGMLQGGDSGPVLEPGKPDESLLISSLKYESYEMPPAGKLPDHIIRDFETWIAKGAVDPREAGSDRRSAQEIDWEVARQFWAFRPLPETPDAVSASAANTTDLIDRHVAHRLQQAEISPNGLAQPEKRLRRLYYDMIGLPPSPEEILEFTRDPSPERWTATVDRLLEMPEFGERWGRHWLDVARYADSNGGDFNATYHNAWRYRDYVIRAYNEDMPIDQFFAEQIAGDLLAAENDEDRRDKLVATGFLMIGPKMLSERDKEKLTYDVIDEQIDTFGKAFLGLSLGCARCHDHKFDPVPTGDYYAMAGIFRGTQVLNGESQQYVSDWLRRELPTSTEHLNSLREHKQRLVELQSQEKAADQRVKKLNERIEQLRKGLNTLVLDNTQAELVGDWKTSTFTSPLVGENYIHDNKENKGEKQVIFSTTLKAAGKYQVLFAYVPSSGRDKQVPVHVEHADERRTHLVDQTKKPPVQGHYVLLEEREFPKNAEVRVVVSTEGTKDYVIVDAVQFIHIPEETNKEVDQEELASAETDLKQQQQQLKELQESIKAHQAEAPPPVPEAIAVRDLETCDDCPIMIRGEHTNPGKLVPRGSLQILSGAQATLEIAEGSGRRELAEWLVTQGAPLASRVYVNRIWMHLLGEGLVQTVDDFGIQGTPPTHPELLDALAVRFLESGWSTKQLVRAIALSEVYQRAKTHSDAAFAQDPENKLLWRGHRRPLSSEELRDTFVVLQQKLDATRGGSPVSKFGRLVVNNSNQGNTEESAEFVSRRSVYHPVLRNQLRGIPVLFDFANPEMVVGKRPITNVPAQALYLLNHPHVRETADTLVERLFAEHGEGSFSALPELYLKIFGRLPEQNDDQLLQNYLQQRLGDEVDSEKIRVAWTEMVQALLISTEFRYLD